MLYLGIDNFIPTLDMQQKQLQYFCITWLGYQSAIYVMLIIRNSHAIEYTAGNIFNQTKGKRVQIQNHYMKLSYVYQWNREYILRLWYQWITNESCRASPLWKLLYFESFNFSSSTPSELDTIHSTSNGLSEIWPSTLVSDFRLRSVALQI